MTTHSLDDIIRRTRPELVSARPLLVGPPPEPAAGRAWLESRFDGARRIP